MVLEQLTFEQFDTLFTPTHIAFIVASENSAFGAMLYLPAFQNSIWKDMFYPINPKYDKILNWKCYPSILDVPQPVDLAYISLKTRYIPQVIRECVEKGVSWIVIFASGFSETGEPEGKELESQIKKIIKGTGTRVIGPNCLGPFNGALGMAFSFNNPKGIPGQVSFMSQSGGHLTQLIDIGFKRDLRFRYGISFGNQIDLNCLDFLKHYRKDLKTKIIAAYLESFGSVKGKDFLMELKKTTLKKPVIIWKGGYTKFGEVAAFSHTGALSSDLRLWKAMAKQGGAILVWDNEEFWNTIKTFELFFPNQLPEGRNMGVITPGGGFSVNMTDLFASHDLKIPPLTRDSQEKISSILPKENVNCKNPIDLGASGFVLEIYLKCIKVVAEDPNIHFIVIPLWQHHIYPHVFKKMIKLLKRYSKPFAFCLPSIADDLELCKRFAKGKEVFHEQRVLYFLSLRYAAKSISHLCDYRDYLLKMKS
ncbi:MAG: CoA-binding protein [Promethearchaeota archaeon]